MGLHGAAEKLFRHKVLALLRRRGLLTEERIELLLSWRRSGFSVHNRVLSFTQPPEVSPRMKTPIGKLPKEALDWLQKAAAAGHAGAMSMLGDLHAAGEGVRNDDNGDVHDGVSVNQDP